MILDSEWVCVRVKWDIHFFRAVGVILEEEYRCFYSNGGGNVSTFGPFILKIKTFSYLRLKVDPAGTVRSSL